jgi:hypothetical protein
MQARQARSGADSADEPVLRAVDGCSPAFGRHWVFAASDAAWRSVLTEEVESLLLDWPGVSPDTITASCGAHAVRVRVGKAALASQSDLERLFRIGEAMARASAAPIR